jgi:hypothetical protein
MWVAVILGGWLATSLLMGPWIGRFIASNARMREDTAKPAGRAQVAGTPAKPLRVARRA